MRQIRGYTQAQLNLLGFVLRGLGVTTRHVLIFPVLGVYETEGKKDFMTTLSAAHQLRGNADQ